MNKRGLRERKREATERALADAAFDLAQERGLDAVVIDDIVERAGYARRTFANHFSCKEEAVAMAVFPQGTDEFTALVEGLPDHTSPLDIVLRFVHMDLTLDFIGKMRRLMDLARRHRALEPYLLIVVRRLETELKTLLADLFEDQYPPGYYHLLTGAVSEALLPVMEGTVPVRMPGDGPANHVGETTYDEYVNAIFHYLRHGF